MGAHRVSRGGGGAVWVWAQDGVLDFPPGCMQIRITSLMAPGHSGKHDTALELQGKTKRLIIGSALIIIATT
jgi:hypothetical protein